MKKVIKNSNKCCNINKMTKTKKIAIDLLIQFDYNPQFVYVICVMSEHRLNMLHSNVSYFQYSEFLFILM